MTTHRRTARFVGGLYITGTVAGILSVVFSGPLFAAEGALMNIAAYEANIALGALCVLIMGFALAMIPALMFTVLRHYNEPLALGYVVFRSGIEAITYMGIAASWLTLIPLSHVLTDTSTVQAFGTLLLDTQGISSILGLAFCTGALMFYVVLFQTRLVPRWLSGWGLLGILLCLIGNFLGWFAVVSHTSDVVTLLELPLALQEMVLAIWLIVKGFNPSAIASGAA